MAKRTFAEAVPLWVKDINDWTARFAGDIGANVPDVLMALDREFRDRLTWDGVPELESSFFRDPDGGWRAWLDSSERDELIRSIMKANGQS